MNSILSEIFYDAGYLFIIIGTLIALIFGLGLILAPTATLKINNMINTRISFREKTKKIETPIKSEPFFYAYAKTSGTFLVAGALFVLYTLVTFNFYSLIPYLPKSISTPAWQWLIQAGQIFFAITCFFILVFGLIVLIRPSNLKKFEQAANRWISTRQRMQSLSREINSANKLVESYPRAFGTFVTIIAIVILILLLPGYLSS